MTSILYRALANLAVPMVPAILRTPRQAEAHAARLGAPSRLAAWAAAHRDPSRPLVWFHAPSVGEGQQARSVMRALRTAHPELQLVYTHFSPSAERFATMVGADASDYLPYDRATDVAATLDAVRPDALVFAKLDVWPEWVAQASRRGIRVGLVAGTVLADSGRLRWPARPALRASYRALAAVGAVSEDDAHRLTRLGVAPDRIVVTGDPRADAVVEAIDGTDPRDPLCMVAVAGRAFVAGSTWPEDEAVVLPAFARLRREHGDARLIVVPHEPTEAHLAHLDAQIAAAGLPPAVRLSAGAGAAWEAPLVVVDSVGGLARLYAGATAAWVGGGFGTAGVHSVLEPAAWRVPVAIGPRDRGLREARLLADAGALHRVPDADSLHQLWDGWLRHPDARREAGHAARAVVERDRGAARMSADLVADLLSEKA